MSTIAEQIQADSTLILERESLADKAASQVRQLILEDRLSPGSKITERELATILGVSRTPLREAIRILANEGLIEMTANKRARVANPSLEEICDLLDVLAALEGAAGELACQRATDSEMKRIARLYDDMVLARKENRHYEFFHFDLDFHKTIVHSSKNQPLIDTHASYNARLYRTRFLSSAKANRRDRALKEHKAILKALQQRDAKLTATKLREHLHQAQKNIAEALSQSTNQP